MRIHRVRGRNLEDALQRARNQFGSSALVLSQESTEGGDVLLSVSDRGQAPGGPSTGGPVERRVFEAAAPASRTPGSERAPAAAPSTAPAIAGEPGAEDVRQRLGRAQASAALTERVLEAVRASGARGAFAIDAAARELARWARPAVSPRADGRLRALAFVGPTGVGKTTTLAKLASRLVRAGRRVALASTDAQRLGAFEQLAAYGRLLQCPVHEIRDGAELARVAAESAHVDALLIDTSGRSPSDARALSELAASLELARVRTPLETYLVLAASASRDALERTTREFAVALPTASILTKLDETRTPAPALELGCATGSGILFLCDGQDVSSHLTRATGDGLADLVLRGRLA